MKILSPMPAGSGAIVIHRQLEARLRGYKVIGYNPMWEYAPFLLGRFSNRRADLIHTVADHAYFLAQHDVPLVVTFQNYVLDSFMRPYSSLAQRIHYRTDLRLFTQLALKRAAVVTAVSQFTADLMKQDMPFSGQVRVIPNAIDSDVFHPTNGNRPAQTRVLFSGNMTIRKGAPTLPTISRHLGSGIKLICATGLRSGAAAFVDDSFKCIGPVPYQEMPNLYNSVDILLMPTVREGLSLAVLEAMACGLPIVTTDCSSMPELVHHEKGGFLCSLGDAEDYAQKINLLAEAPQLRRTMGEYNRARIESCYRLETMLQSYRDLFEEVLSRRSQ
ncbi:MAG: glycosyltransferase family 4 protein [Acidiferrobacterales bacterium]